MSTVTEVKAQPRSGLLHIDALLDEGPGWNWLEPARNTLRYSFSLDEPNAGDAGRLYSGERSTFNAEQQAAVVQALGRMAAITGIRFEATTRAADADLHFSAVNLLGTQNAGYASTRWNYSFDGQQRITRYSADAWIYLDNMEWATHNARPAPGNAGFEVLLHEIGHAMGLKHPFEDDPRLAPADDHTGNTLMSYTGRGGPHSDYAPFDHAALAFLYGGDGLGGALGVGGSGWLLTGTPAADRLLGSAGHDRIVGQAGLDTAVYTQARERYAVNATGGRVQVEGPEGRDTLEQVERVAFADRSLAFDIGGAAGTTARYLGAVFGRDAVHNATYAGIGLRLLDSGTTPDALMLLALQARLGNGFTPEALVDLLYTQLVGQPPTQGERLFWVGTLNSGQYSSVSLAQMAAGLDLNAQNIDLVGLASAGLPYT